jgi:AcrR family transcriptional regulator
MDRVQTRTGGRSADVRGRVLSAVRAALEAGDPDALAIERLAEQAHVSRATIYRRWLSTSSLVAELLTGLTPVQTPLPDTGDLRADLARVARRVTQTMSTPFARTTLKLVAASTDPHLVQAAAGYWASVLDRTAEVVRSAQQRGAATLEVDPVEAIESLLGPIYLRLLVTQQPVPEDDLHRLVARTARMLRTELG